MSVASALGLLRSFAIYWRPGRQPGLRRLYTSFIQPGDLVFDVGAHLGDRSVAFAALGARVVAFEPQPRIARWLRRITRRHDTITVRSEAVGATPGTAVLSMSRGHPTVSTIAAGWRSSVAEAHPGFRSVRWEEAVEVPVVTLDAVIAEYGVPAFCKIDVEGHEPEVLAGLSRAVPAVSVEFLSGQLDPVRACVERLEALGCYRFNAVAGEGRAFVFEPWTDADGVIEWLAGGAGGASSGDLYARLEGAGRHGAPGSAVT